MARRRKGEQPQNNGDTFHSFRGIDESTLDWISLLRGLTGQTSGEVISDAVEALVWFFQHANTNLSANRKWMMARLLLRRLPRFLHPEEFTDGGGI